MHILGLSLIRSIAEGLGKDKNFFDPWFKDESSAIFRAIHYKSSDSLKTKKSQTAQRLAAVEHTDTGFITLLSSLMENDL